MDKRSPLTIGLLIKDSLPHKVLARQALKRNKITVYLFPKRYYTKTHSVLINRWGTNFRVMHISPELSTILCEQLSPMIKGFFESTVKMAAK